MAKKPKRDPDLPLFREAVRLRVIQMKENEAEGDFDPSDPEYATLMEPALWSVYFDSLWALMNHQEKVEVILALVVQVTQSDSISFASVWTKHLDEIAGSIPPDKQGHIIDTFLINAGQARQRAMLIGPLQ